MVLLRRVLTTFLLLAGLAVVGLGIFAYIQAASSEIADAVPRPMLLR